MSLQFLLYTCFITLETVLISLQFLLYTCVSAWIACTHQNDLLEVLQMSLQSLLNIYFLTMSKTDLESPNGDSSNA